MNDLTVILLTPNKVPEQWAEFHKEKLLEAIGDTPLITVSSKPLDWGLNLIQTEYSLSNIFWQMLRAAKVATTEYIAIAEDDTLYTKEHFEYRPSSDCWAYNMNRWKIFTWGKPFYFYKPGASNGTMIGSRQLTIEALEARFIGCSGELIWKYCKELGVHPRSIKYDKGSFCTFRTELSVVGFVHPFSIDPLAQRGRKVSGPIRASDLPFWGSARELRRNFR